MTLVFSETESAGEGFDTPPVDNGNPTVSSEYTCSECGSPLVYSGRGRKPKRCTLTNGGSAECAAKRAGGSVSRTSSKGSNEKLAQDAVAVLTSMHDFMTMGAMFMQLTNTAATINAANETFIPRATAALANNPNLCRKIIKMGGTGGAAMLLGAYAAFIGTVAPVAALEIKALQIQAKESKGK